MKRSAPIPDPDPDLGTVPEDTMAVLITAVAVVVDSGLDHRHVTDVIMIIETITVIVAESEETGKGSETEIMGETIANENAKRNENQKEKEKENVTEKEKENENIKFVASKSIFK